MDVHVSDYGYDNGWLVKERDNGYVDDGNDECFTKMMMIITIVVFVFTSISHRLNTLGKTQRLLLLLYTAALAPHQFQHQCNLHYISILGT